MEDDADAPLAVPSNDVARLELAGLSRAPAPWLGRAPHPELALHSRASDELELLYPLSLGRFRDRGGESLMKARRELAIAEKSACLAQVGSLADVELADDHLRE